MSDSVFSPPAPGVVSKSEKHFRSQHDTMMIAKARTKSFALSAINACALIIVACCDRVVVFTFQHNSWRLVPLQLSTAFLSAKSMTALVNLKS